MTYNVFGGMLSLTQSILLAILGWMEIYCINAECYGRCVVYFDINYTACSE